MKTLRYVFLFSLFFGLLLQVGCNGSGGASNTSITGNGTLSLAIADTPVDDADSVVVTFTGVEIQPGGSDDEDSDGSQGDNDADDATEAPNPSSSMPSSDSDEMDNSDEGSNAKPLVFNFSAPMTIDLMAQQGTNSATLLDGITLPAGNYDWIRLKVDPSRSTITLKDGSVHPLFIPSGDQTGLKLVHGFTVAANGAVDFTIDFDLRRSIVLAHGKYILKPALRLINNQEVGSLSGTVSNTFTLGTVAVSDPACSPAAYIYSGADVTPVDINTTSAVQPVATASVTLDNGSGNYTYAQAFLAPGDYTVALVCAAGDDPTASDTLTFSAAKNATVTAAQTTTVDFP